MKKKMTKFEIVMEIAIKIVHLSKLSGSVMTSKIDDGTKHQ